MQFHILTLFPEMVENGLQTSILGRAIQKGLIGIHAVNIRDYTQDKHNKVDDYPYGGGAGMLMQAQPVYDAWKAVAKPAEGKKTVRVLFMSPQGKTFSQEMAKELAQEEELIFLCGHYEGIDERVIEEIVTDPVSIGDYVLTGGELPALEAAIRAVAASGADAVICQDLAVATLIGRIAPQLPRHGSTQMSVHSLQGALELKELGFTRVVLARELSLPEVEHITKHCGIETECFVHGALCMCVSGQCYMSAFLGGRSGNRGSCAGPCRLTAPCAPALKLGSRCRSRP